MTIREKLINLRRYNDMVLYRWTAGYSKIAGKFYPLQNLRLIVLSCNNGNLVYSSSAPIMYNVHGRPTIVFKDRNVMTVIDGSSYLCIYGDRAFRISKNLLKDKK